MKKQFVIFFTIVLSVYALINFYILFRAWHALAPLSELRTVIVLAAAFFVMLYPLGRVLERYTLSRVSEIIVYAGAVWLAEMVYLFLLTALVDIISAIAFFLPAYSFAFQLPATKLYIEFGIMAVATLATLLGFLNARFPQIKELHFSVPKKSSSVSELKIAAISDIHLGTIMGPKRLHYIVDKVNTINADIILLVGDVFDEDIGRVIKNNLGDLLRQMKSKYGIFAVTGNHEYFGGVEQAVAYLREHGITVLRDETFSVENMLTIIGRDDISSAGMGIKRGKRKSLSELYTNTLPTIVLDHQPFNLNEAADVGADVQLSGHTHHGQLFPFNFITKKVYEVSWGYKKKGNTHFYVSCGAGSWGPPVRTGNTPEILSITLRLV
jgi:uncharacterized protein